MEHLEIGFIFCLVPMLASFLVFLMELAVKWTKKLFKTIARYLVATCVVVTFLRRVRH